MNYPVWKEWVKPEPPASESGSGTGAGTGGGGNNGPPSGKTRRKRQIGKDLMDYYYDYYGEVPDECTKTVLNLDHCNYKPKVFIISNNYSRRNYYCYHQNTK